MFERRIGRMGFLLGIVYWAAIIVIPAILELTVHYLANSSGAATPNPSTAVVNVISILLGIGALVLMFPVIISLYVRRLHDANQSGWLTLLLLVPFVSTFLFLYLLFVPGSQGPNKYGEPVNSFNYWVVLGFKKP